MATSSLSDSVFRLTVLATGGTIEKTYDAHEGRLCLDEPVMEALCARLCHPDVEISIVRVMSLDSLEMGPAERETVVAAARRVIEHHAADAIVVTHGTDTLSATASALAAAWPTPPLPVVLTGSMRPFRVADSDALQNMAQAIMAARLVTPGVYGVMHGRVIPAGRIVKDYERLTFVDSGTSPGG